ncbi:MAG: LacI family transcriptional regulator [Anaerolineae bacterium]|nr:LacI family transcriptional regulator [Anaerolineae bacterium]
MPKSNPTIYDVAREAGVSISTVSRVLNAYKEVNEETRATVLAAIETLGYVPKAEARARALKETRRIGVITPFFTAPAFVQRLRGVAAAVASKNYELVVYTVDSLDTLSDYLDTLPFSTHNLGGLIFISININDEQAERLLKHGLDAVLIEHSTQLLSSVEIDDVAGGKMATEYLINKGHQRIAFVGDSNRMDYVVQTTELRLKGFRKALQAASINIPDDYIHLVQYDIETTRQLGREILSLPDRPSAIFAATDLQAMAVIKAAHDLKLRIPEDLSVVGFDDLDMADYVDLTTVRQHLDESGRIAAELLMSRLAEPDRLIQHVQLPLTMIKRLTA